MTIEELSEAIDQIARSYSAKVDRVDRDDVAGDIWAEVLKHQENGDRWNLAYLVNVATYAAIKSIRKWTTPIGHDHIDEPSDPPVDWEDFYNLIDRLKSDRHRLALRLIAQGQTVSQIAEHLQISIDQAREALRGGKSALQKLIRRLPESHRRDIRDINRRAKSDR